MSGRPVAWGTGAGVALAAVTSALVNELHGGWPWWIAVAVVTVVAAALAGWVASRSGGSDTVVVEAGGVYAVENIDGTVRTRPQPADGATPRQGVWRWIAPGAVFAGRRIGQTARIDTTGGNTGLSKGGSSAGTP